MAFGVGFGRTQEAARFDDRSTLCCDAAEMRAAHWVRSVMTLDAIMVIAASFESAGFASEAALFFPELVVASAAQRRGPAPVFAAWRKKPLRLYDGLKDCLCRQVFENAGTLPFVINSSTARALGLTVPETLLATADEVIQ